MKKTIFLALAIAFASLATFAQNGAVADAKEKLERADPLFQKAQQQVKAGVNPIPALEEAAKKGNSLAAFYLGRGYLNLKDDEKATKWFTVAIHLGNPEAAYFFSENYLEKTGLYANMMVYYIGIKNAAELGSYKGAYEYANHLLDEEDYPNALKYYLVAFNNLGAVYQDLYDGQKEIMGEIANKLGHLYLSEHKGIKDDVDECLHWFKIAASLNNKDAANWLEVQRAGYTYKRYEPAPDFTSAAEFAAEMNKYFYTATINFGEKSFLYRFDSRGKLDFNKKSILFTAQGDRLYIKMNIPANGDCDYGLKEVKAVRTGKSGRFSETTYGFYICFKYSYQCGPYNYETLNLYFDDPHDIISERAMRYVTAHCNE